jgi:hypothetical protein
MTIGRALEIYGRERAPNVASPETIGYHIDALDPFWGELPVSAIKGATPMFARVRPSSQRQRGEN